MIKQTIDQDLKTAMLAGDKQLVSVLRGLKSTILYAEVAADARDTGLDDPIVAGLMQKESKKRSDAIELYQNAGEQDRAAQELYEQQIIAKYLPEQMSVEQIRELIDKTIHAEDVAPTMQSMGVIIGKVKAEARGSADGGTIARLVKERLAS